MRSVREAIVPTLSRMLARDGFPPHRARQFWRVFDLLTRESLDYPSARPRPPFSGICNDGTPWEFCVSLGDGGEGGMIRYLTEVGAPGSPLSARTDLTQRRLAEISRQLGLSPESEDAVAAVLTVLPESAARLDRLRGGVWIAVGCGADRGPHLRVYANNEWGEEARRWERLVEALRRLGAAGFGRRLRSLTAVLVPAFTPVGLAVTLGGNRRLKLYLRAKVSPWPACARLLESLELQAAPDLLHLLERGLQRPLASLPDHALVLSLGARDTGADLDLKLDLCGHCLFRSDAEARQAVDRLARCAGIDALPYQRARDLLLAGRPAGRRECTYDFVGLGAGPKGLRLNVYLRPPELAARHSARVGAPRSAEIRRALVRGVQHLLDRQHDPGAWADFHLPVGAATTWIAAYIGNALLAAKPFLAPDDRLDAAITAAADRLVAAFRPSGWGYNPTTECDADSTALAILFLSGAGRDVRWGLPVLQRFSDGRGGHGTFRPEDQMSCWGEVHCDVVPTLLRALGSSAGDAAQAVLRLRAPAGCWHSYWWTTDLYATEAALAFLTHTPAWEQCEASRPWLVDQAEAPGDVFETALCLSALQHLDPRLGRSADPAIARLCATLLAAQGADGGWPGAAGLRLPDRACSQPWRHPETTRIYLDTGLFTSATAVAALARRAASLLA